ncbi:MAG: zonular occludens toxin domain-containing protein [Candidatus Micrarchaeaceae archaeon]
MIESVLEISGVSPFGIDGSAFLESIGHRSFILIYDLTIHKTFIYMNDIAFYSKFKNLLSHISGVQTTNQNFELQENTFQITSIYKRSKTIKLISDILAPQFSEGIVLFLFIAQNESEVSKFKEPMETYLSNQKIKSTISIPSGIFKSSTSLHMDLFENSEEREMLISIIEDLNSTILEGKSAFKFFVAVPISFKSILEEIKSRSIVTYDEIISVNSLNHFINLLSSKDNIIYGKSYLSNMIEGFGAYPIYGLPTLYYESLPGLLIGRYMDYGTIETNLHVSIQPEALNLGFIISGLPGSGKTSEAMSIINQLKNHSNTKIAVISPTEEWDSFALEKEMNLIRIGEDGIPINFFSCSSNNKAKFYEDLSMLIATASNSGPYESPMEKCLLNAFSYAFQNSSSPNPSFVYDCIEESVIKMHGKRTNTGIKYTKHGENIHAALETLRNLLSNFEYTCTKGVSFSDLLKKGVVFDLSKISNRMKPYFYALILNQLYSIIEELDVNGNNELRILIAIEEAQIIFGDSQRNTAASDDLENRIQDFRKKGIGIMLLVHSLNDIKANIRRMCQNKLYLKQAPDIAAIATKELVFTYPNQDELIMKLKHLDSRIGAFDYISKKEGNTSSHDSIFIKTEDFLLPHINLYVHKKHINPVISCKISIEDKRQKQSKQIYALRVYYLGKELDTYLIQNNFCILSLLPERYYCVDLLSEQLHKITSCKFFSKKDIKIIVTDFDTTVENQ